MPDQQRGEQEREQQHAAAGVADTERAIGEISERRSYRRRRDDRDPIEDRVKFPSPNLRIDRNGEDDGEDSRADEIAEVQRHRKRIAACFAERRGCNLDQPKNERDFRHLAYCVLR